MKPTQDLQGSEGISGSSGTATLGSDILNDERNHGDEKEQQVEHRSTNCGLFGTPKSTDLNMISENSSGFHLPDSRFAELESPNMKLRKYAEESQIRVAA
ncbi:hypothetical protein V865_008506 [Kwoniella europaea PYCC6329]|uniref:Uncharacterized protein n=1 Tax=Kwoniella europaea PYCC6329 TaxID=1423913 RepID=A0AAX4KVN4_9TREE